MKQERSFIVDALFVLALFGVFAVSAFVLITIGADVYQHTVQDMTSNYETRIAVSYITEKVRQNDTSVSDTETAASISTLNGTRALKLAQEIDGQLYYTYLYLYDGHLKELFTQRYDSLGGNALEAGVNIMELDYFKIEQAASGLLSVEVTTAHGNPYQFYISTHSQNAEN